MAAAIMVQRPTNACVLSLLAGRQCITKLLTTRVEMEFITDKLEEISDATRAARTTPRTPLGSSSFSSATQVVLASRSGNNTSNDARQGEDEHRRQFQQHGEHRTPASLLEVAGARNALDVPRSERPPT